MLIKIINIISKMSKYDKKECNNICTIDKKSHCIKVYKLTKAHLISSTAPTCYNTLLASYTPHICFWWCQSSLVNMKQNGVKSKAPQCLEKSYFLCHNIMRLPLKLPKKTYLINPQTNQLMNKLTRGKLTTALVCYEYRPFYPCYNLQIDTMLT